MTLTRRTNIQKVKEIIKEMDCDPMLQMVVITALSNYTQAVLHTTEDEWNKTGAGKMIVFSHWEKACKQLLSIIDGD